MNKDHFLQHYLTGCRWAMQRQTLQALCGIVERHITGEKLSDEQIRAVVSTRKTEENETRKYTLMPDGKGVLSITGVIAKYSSMVNDVSQPQGTSIEFLSEQLDLMLQDNRVKSIFLRFESPGGTWSGQPDFVDKLWKASFAKPIISFADDIADSAAYYLASQGNIFLANQSALVGSIGVYMVIPDLSKRAEALGIKYNIVASGENKGAGYPGSEVTDSQLAVFADEIDADHEMFLRGVLRGRAAAGLSEENLRKLADGREYNAAAAVEHKLIDKIMTLEEALAIEAPPVREAGAFIRHDGFTAAVSAETIKQNRKGKTMEQEKTQAQDAAAEAGTDKQSDIGTERARILAIQSALAGVEFKEVCAKAVAEEWDLQKAKAEAFEVAQKKRDQEARAADEKIALLQTRLDAIAKSGHSDELIPQQPTDSANPLKKDGSAVGSAEAFETVVTNLQADGKTTRAQAIAKAVKSHTDDHKAWLGSKQKK